MSTLDQTVHFDFRDNNPKNVHETLETVYKALEEKGYNPINQIVVSDFWGPGLYSTVQ